VPKAFMEVPHTAWKTGWSRLSCLNSPAFWKGNVCS